MRPVLATTKGATQHFFANHKTSSEQKNRNSFISDHSQMRIKSDWELMRKARWKWLDCDVKNLKESLSYLQLLTGSLMYFIFQFLRLHIPVSIFCLFVSVCVNGNRVQCPMFSKSICKFLSAWSSHLARLASALSNWLLCSFPFATFLSCIYSLLYNFWARKKIVVVGKVVHFHHWKDK